MNPISCCGTNCLECYCYGNLCSGCNECEGKVFHAPAGKACRIYDCVINSKKLANCGDCKNVPCDIWKTTRDPKFTDEEFRRNICERITNLKNLKGSE